MFCRCFWNGITWPTIHWKKKYRAWRLGLKFAVLKYQIFWFSWLRLEMKGLVGYSKLQFFAMLCMPFLVHYTRVTQCRTLRFALPVKWIVVRSRTTHKRHTWTNFKPRYPWLLNYLTLHHRRHPIDIWRVFFWQGMIRDLAPTYTLPRRSQ